MKNYFKNWNFMRFLRLGMAVYIIVIGIQENNLWFIILGVLFSLMPLFNIGCCGVSSCNTQEIKNNTNPAEVTFEEVK
jgi:hypothetical protein